jgi:hypothetical protein
MSNSKKQHNIPCEMYCNSNFGYQMPDYYLPESSNVQKTQPINDYNLNRNLYNNYYNYNQHVQAYSEYFLNDGNFYQNSQVTSPDCLQQYQFVNQPHHSSSSYGHGQIFQNYCDYDSTLNIKNGEFFNPSGTSSNSNKNGKLIESSPSVSIDSVSMLPIKSEKDIKGEKMEKKMKKRGRVIANHHQLPEIAVITLNTWFDLHINHPYPTAVEKLRLAEESGISLKQVNSWFCNRRNRSLNTKPKRIKRQLEQEISNVFSELEKNINNTQVIVKFRNTLIMHDIDVGK